MYVAWNPLVFPHPQNPKIKGSASIAIIIARNDKIRVSHRGKNVRFLLVGWMVELQSLGAIKINKSNRLKTRKGSLGKRKENKENQKFNRKRRRYKCHVLWAIESCFRVNLAEIKQSWFKGTYGHVSLSKANKNCKSIAPFLSKK